VAGPGSVDVATRGAAWAGGGNCSGPGWSKGSRDSGAVATPVLRAPLRAGLGLAGSYSRLAKQKAHDRADGEAYGQVQGQQQNIHGFFLQRDRCTRPDSKLV
jgi:hypothetical protein